MIPEPQAPRLKSRSTAQNIFELLRADIVLGNLKPLEPIKEADIALKLGVSRTPVREALLRLQNLGLIEIFPQAGTRVAPVRLQKVVAAQLIREAVEVEVVRRACRSASDSALEAIGHLIEDQVIAAKRNDLVRLFELDESFHRAIHEAAALGSVADELEDVKVHLNRLRFISVNWPRGADKITSEHTAILDAMRARDESRAAAAMTLHLRAVLPVLEAMAKREKGVPDIPTEGLP